MNNYKEAGVDIDKANNFISVITPFIKKTFNKNVIDNFGSFASFYDLQFLKNYSNPILVTTTDGVGSKLKIAIMAKKFDTIGIDLVAMNVNDLLVVGAKPLVFLDYIATGNLNIAQMAEVVKGIARGCEIADIALVGGETAELPSLYSKNDFDLAGFCAGVMEKNNIIDGSHVKKGDIIIGLPSSGFHSNGYALIRKICFEDNNFPLDFKINNNLTLEDILLIPTKIYTNAIERLISSGTFPKSMAHITGGGFYDNIKRVIPKDVDAIVFPESWERPICYDFLMNYSQMEIKELYRVFNMGIGLTMIFDNNMFKTATAILDKLNEKYYIIGEIVEGDGKVLIKGIDL